VSLYTRVWRKRVVVSWHSLGVEKVIHGELAYVGVVSLSLGEFLFPDVVRVSQVNWCNKVG
jgi:hypothetical protein